MLNARLELTPQHPTSWSWHHLVMASSWSWHMCHGAPQRCRQGHRRGGAVTGTKEVGTRIGRAHFCAVEPVRHLCGLLDLNRRSHITTAPRTETTRACAVTPCIGADGVPGILTRATACYVLVDDRLQAAPPVEAYVTPSRYAEVDTRTPVSLRARTDSGYGGRNSRFVGGYRGGTATASADDLRRGRPPSSITTTTHARNEPYARDRGRPSSLALTPRPLALNSRVSPSSHRAASDGSWPPLPRVARHASTIGRDQTDSLDLGSPYSTRR